MERSKELRHINNEEWMIESLSSMLEDGETLRCPIYGMLFQSRIRLSTYSCFFGLTKNYLLIAILSPFTKSVSWTSRVPLDVKKVKVKKRLLWRKITIRFNEGKPCRMLVSRKAMGIKNQEQNLEEFIRHIHDF